MIDLSSRNYTILEEHITMSNKAFSLFTLTLLIFPHFAFSHWWFMSQVYSSGAEIMCNVADLPSHQLQMCRRNPDVVVRIGEGVKTAIKECQKQMKNEKWNCSTEAQDSTVFGKITRKATAETAFIHAISTAGVVHEISRACRRGKLRECLECNKNPDFVDSNDGFQWAGCGAHVNYGTDVAETFVDSLEVGRDARAKINLHNNRVGRRAVQQQTVRVCKCHGISGSCEYQTCYKSLAPFGKVGSYLLKKYHKVAKVTVNQSDNELILADKKHTKNPSHDALVFSVKSPDFCKPNSSTGSIGTKGRYCSKTTTGRGSCKVLCCGRGYNILQERRVYNCSCQFYWCCHIKCEKCSQVVETYICS